MSKHDKENDIKNLLDSVTQITKYHDKYANSNGEEFNIFSILRVKRKEVETHSRFIYELLNPKGSHGQNDLFLKLFIVDALGINDVSNIYNPKREDSTNEHRRIDFTIETNKHMIGIEMKIDAADKKNQMFDYFQELKRRSNNREVKLFYLSLDGKNASSESLGVLEDDQYENISFQYNIISWIESCIKEVSLKHVIREALLQYKILIESLTGQRGKIQMEISKQLILDSKSLRSALLIEKSLVESKIIIQTQFWNELKKSIQKYHNRDIKIYGANSIEDFVRKYYKNKKNNKHIGLKFEIIDYKEYSIWLYINLYHVIHYGLRVENKDGKIISNSDLKTTLRQSISLNDGNAVADSGKDWIVCYYYDDKNKHEIIDFNDFNRLKTVTISLVDKEERERIVNNITIHINYLVEETSKKIKYLTTRIA